MNRFQSQRSGQQSVELRSTLSNVSALENILRIGNQGDVFSASPGTVGRPAWSCGASIATARMPSSRLHFPNEHFFITS
jgi:hypothetical protein